MQYLSKMTTNGQLAVINETFMEILINQIDSRPSNLFNYTALLREFHDDMSALLQYITQRIDYYGGYGKRTFNIRRDCAL